MATIIDNVSLADGEIISSAIANPNNVRIQTEISGAGAGEWVIQSYLVNDGSADVHLLDENNARITHKIIGNKEVSVNIIVINSASLKVRLTPGAAGNTGAATVTTKET
jgi:microcompartment protein CcmK/EutM